MSTEVHLEYLRRPPVSSASLAPRVPTVTLISHKPPQDRAGARRQQDLALSTAGYYRCREGTLGCPEGMSSKVLWQCLQQW